MKYKNTNSLTAKVRRRARPHPQSGLRPRGPGAPASPAASLLVGDHPPGADDAAGIGQLPQSSPARGIPSSSVSPSQVHFIVRSRNGPAHLPATIGAAWRPPFHPRCVCKSSSTSALHKRLSC